MCASTIGAQQCVIKATLCFDYADQIAMSAHVRGHGQCTVLRL